MCRCAHVSDETDREKLMVNTFVNFKQVSRFKNSSDMREFYNLNNSRSKEVMNL